MVHALCCQGGTETRLQSPAGLRKCTLIFFLITIYVKRMAKTQHENAAKHPFVFVSCFNMKNIMAGVKSLSRVRA